MKLLVEKKIIIEIGITQLNSEKDCEVRKKVQPYWYYSRTQKAGE